MIISEKRNHKKSKKIESKWQNNICVHLHKFCFLFPYFFYYSSSFPYNYLLPHILFSFFSHTIPLFPIQLTFILK